MCHCLRVITSLFENDSEFNVIFQSEYRYSDPLSVHKKPRKACFMNPLVSINNGLLMYYQVFVTCGWARFLFHVTCIWKRDQEYRFYINTARLRFLTELHLFNNIISFSYIHLFIYYLLVSFTIIYSFFFISSNLKFQNVKSFYACSEFATSCQILGLCTIKAV